MNRGQRTIAGLLTVIVALLLLDVSLQGEQRAEAQQTQIGGEPTIAKLLPVYSGTYIRVWSDGRADWVAASDASSCDYSVNAAWSHGAVDHPFPVVDAELGWHGSQAAAVLMRFEDGRTDYVAMTQQARCTIAGEGSQSFCTGDTDRNFDVGLDDLLAVLSQWGPCVE